MKDQDAIIALLGDIRELLFGIAILILSVFLCLLGALLGSWGLLVCCVIGIFLGLYGILVIVHGHHHHKIVEKQD